MLLPMFLEMLFAQHLLLRRKHLTSSERMELYSGGGNLQFIVGITGRK
jgi:hypothetical protein